MKNKGQINLEKIGKVAIAVLVLAVLSVAALLVISIMSSSNVVKTGTLTKTVYNETLGNITHGGYLLATYTTRGFTNPVIVTATNATSGALISSDNYTVSNVGNVTNATFNNWDVVNFTYRYSYNDNIANNAQDLSGNVSQGNTSFFTNMPTIFTILGVALIIGIIGLVVVVVRNLRSKGEMSYT